MTFYMLLAVFFSFCLGYFLCVILTAAKVSDIQSEAISMVAKYKGKLFEELNAEETNEMLCAEAQDFCRAALRKPVMYECSNCKHNFKRDYCANYTSCPRCGWKLAQPLEEKTN